jgi:5'(3')-deoxyribonucleotidase
MGPLIILLDVDEVLARYHERALAVAKGIAKDRGWSHLDVFDEESIDQWEIDRWFLARIPSGNEWFVEAYWRAMNKPGQIRSLNPYAGNVEAVDRLRELGTVKFVTAATPTCATWADERLNWLAAHCNASHKDVIIASEKYLVHGDVFVDDRIENLDRWTDYWEKRSKTSPLPLLMHRSHNEKTLSTHRRVTDLRQVEAAVGALLRERS